MIEIRTKDETFEIKSTPEELTLGDFEQIQRHLNNNSLTAIEKYENIMQYLGLPKGIVEQMVFEFTSEADKDKRKETTFMQMVKEFNSHTTSSEFQSTFEHDGVVYTSTNSNGDTKLITKDLKLIEKASKGNPIHAPSTYLAIIFKDENIDNYSPLMIEKKAKIFRKNMPSSIALPYIMLIGQRILKQLEDINGVG